jgi:hypothetical protein
MHMVSRVVCLYTQGSPVENSNSNTLEPDWTQRNRPAACVIAQQYSSPTFVPLRFLSRMEKFGAFKKR